MAPNHFSCDQPFSFHENVSWKHVALAAFRITTVFISNAEYGIDLKRGS